MKTLLTVALFGLSTLAFAQEPTPPTPAPAPAPAEKPAPQKPKTLQLGARLDGGITLKDIDGKEVKAKEHMGKITVVNFYSIQCPIQRAWDGRLAAIQKEYEAKGVVFYNIDSNHTEIGKEAPKGETDADPYDNIRSHLKKQGLPFRVLVDHGNVIADVFEARTTPDIFVFGTDGKLIYRGLIDDDQQDKKGDAAKRYLRDTLDKLLAGEKLEPFATTPVGCTIKRVSAGGAEGGRRRRGEGGGE